MQALVVALITLLASPMLLLLSAMATAVLFVLLLCVIVCGFFVYICKEGWSRGVKTS